MSHSTNDSAGPSRQVYDARSITVLPGLEAVRRRPGMYIGATDVQGLHHLVFEAVDNAVDESLAGFCARIAVAVHRDGSCSVEDDGRGIPVDLHPDENKPACEVVLTTLHSGGKFERGSYGIAAGLHGIGISTVNALSEWLTLDVYRDGVSYRQRYRRGRVASPLEEVGSIERRGTRIHFMPDAEIFGAGVEFSAERLLSRLRELAFLEPGIEIRYSDERDGRDELFCFAGGIPSFVEHLNRARTALHPAPIHMRSRLNGIRIELGLQWTTGYAEDLCSFVNHVRTSDHGSHVDGLMAAMTRAMNRHAADRRLLESGERLQTMDLLEGLAGVLSVQMTEPQLEGQTKTRLRSDHVAEVVEEGVVRHLASYLEENRSVAATIIGRALEAQRARIAARRASESARYEASQAEVNEDVYRAQFGIRSENWHESATWITHENLLAAHAAASKMPEDGVLLDVCCGSGVVGASFQGKVGRIVGLDLTPQMAALARTRLDEVHLGNIYHIPFDEGTFDGVVTREVLHLLPEPERPVAQIFRVLKPGGQFIVGHILPYGPTDAPWMWRVFKKKQPLIFSMFQEEDFRALLEQAGFVDIEMTEQTVWESIDLWIDTHETPAIHRHEIRRLFDSAPQMVRDVHPFEILPSGEIRDLWRWCVFSARKP